MSDVDILTVPEACAFLKCSRSYLYKQAQKGEIPAIKLGRHWRFTRSSLEEWLNQNFVERKRA